MIRRIDKHLLKIFGYSKIIECNICHNKLFSGNYIVITVRYPNVDNFEATNKYFCRSERMCKDCYLKLIESGKYWDVNHIINNDLKWKS